MYFQTQNGEYIQYRLDGEGSLFVLFHPFGASLRYFDNVTRSLVMRGHRVVRFDLPGHGCSSLGRKRQTLATCTAVVESLLNRTASHNATFIACDFGAYLAASVAMHALAKPRALVIANAMLRPNSWVEQRQSDLMRMAADRLTIRTTATMRPPPSVDVLEERHQLCQSVRVLHEYADIFAALPPLTQSQISGHVPTYSTTFSRVQQPETALMTAVDATD